MDNFDLSPEALEASLTGLDAADVQEFATSLDYEQCVSLNKKELTDFVHLVEPLTKASIDNYGKSVFFHCLSNELIEVSYYNAPYRVVARVSNASGKQVPDFSILVSTLKKLLCNTFASLILVQQDSQLNVAFGEQLIYVETIPLHAEVYEFTRQTPESLIDKDLASYVFRKVGTILNQTERAAEKVVVIKDRQVHFNTGVFAAAINSPFSGDESCVIYKAVADVLASLSDITKSQLRYCITDSAFVLDSDGVIYCELPVGLGDKVNEFISASAQFALSFKADIEVINDALLKLVSLVQSLDYLSNVVKLGFTDKAMTLQLATADHSRTFPYEFAITSGKPEVLGEASLTVEILKVFLNIVGTVGVKYSFTDSGIGISNEFGKFLIRKA